ncbi:MAG: hypothetical protein HOM11_12225 [Methylococcales bacterium]|jgi:predicted GTPase|nr:hypothetical protein [Methylococcales bacterium]MBT7444595.1 hypothetical protein [Methylococcales bacterium]
MQYVDFKEQLNSYNDWKKGLAANILKFKAWLHERKIATDETDSRIEHTLKVIREDKLTIAFVAEFSRGKSELINAIFFADFGRRLLPSSAGRTTMCPTEIFYDNEQDSAYIQLLPIDTRNTDTTILEYRNRPEAWHRIDLDLDNPEQMQEALKEVVQVKRVSIDEAKKLGLYDDEMLNELNNDKQGGKASFAEIPCWRHALISFPHPLLKQGVTILDTPGLNALGSEPELTINMLPNAQAILFLLSADTGVTRSDLEIWKHHINVHTNGLMVVLNKIDSLWDELHDSATIQATINEQCQNTASILNIDSKKVFPISAQKGLIAKVKNDEELLEKSNLLSLEQYLSEDLLDNKQAIIMDTINHEIGHLLNNTKKMLEHRSGNIKKQKTELGNLEHKNQDVVIKLMQKTREEQTIYMKNVENFQASQKILEQHGRNLMDALSLTAFDMHVARGTAEMENRWTTFGLKSAMEDLFQGIETAVLEINSRADQTRKLVSSTYRKFRQEYGMTAVPPRMFSTNDFHTEFELLQREAEAFRNNPTLLVTESGFVIKKFLNLLVKRARDIFEKNQKRALPWTKTALNPLKVQLKDYKQHMESRLETLRKMTKSKDHLQQKIAELEKHDAILEKHLNSLLALDNAIHQDIPGLHADA